jgi:hypothetical protein
MKYRAKGIQVSTKIASTTCRMINFLYSRKEKRQKKKEKKGKKEKEKQLCTEATRLQREALSSGFDSNSWAVGRAGAFSSLHSFFGDSGSYNVIVYQILSTKVSMGRNKPTFP